MENELLKKIVAEKAKNNNTIDLNAYAMGVKDGIEKSKAPEMLEKLIEIYTALKHNNFKHNESYFRSTVEKLIKEATTI